MSLTQPILRYFSDPDLTRNVEITGPTRELAVDGRRGLLPLSIHTSIAIPQHLLNEPVGSMTVWLMSLEELDTVCHQEHIRSYDPHYAAYTLFADYQEIRSWPEATFALVWSSGWYPQFFAKFYQGNIYPSAYYPVHRGFVAAGHWHIARHKWYNIALTWNKPASEYRLYVNSVCVAVSNRFQQLTSENCASTLYAGNTVFALSELQFFDRALTQGQLEDTYENEATANNSEIDSDLQRTYAGRGLQQVSWEPTSEWKPQLQLSLDCPEHLDAFVGQGCTSAIQINSEGLELCTPQRFSAEEAPHWGHESSMTDPITNGPLPSYMLQPVATRAEWPNRDRSQVYLWTRRSFEGDIFIELEFKALQENGLGLLMFHAAGMQREDILVDYSARQSGSMSTVCWENVRNYHWEFYRQLTDARNDVASHVLVKNPWLRPLHYTCQSKRLSVETWHHLQFMQQGGHLRGAVDGELVIDVHDMPSTGTGGVLDCGHLVIRAMLNTRIRFRNLCVYNRNSLG